ncbi:MAG: DDE-type integrase/transposase/recombinase [Leptospiraceae bacterium]|nr:DDE-type integrase/transposase/recombinase [Leptospiraceae bacterium]
MAKEIDKKLMAMLIEEHKRLRRNEVGEFLARIEKIYGIEKNYFYRCRRNLDALNRKQRSDRGCPRVIESETFFKDIKMIAAIKMASSLNHRNDWKFFRNKKFNTTDLAIAIALSQNKISQKYSKSTVNYWIRKLGLDFDAVFRKLAAIRITADHSNHVWLGDATTIESIYLQENGKLIYDPSIARDKNHSEDRIKRKKLRKVWIYFVVDKYSGAFYIHPFIGTQLGENPQHWIETYKYCMTNSDEKDARIPFSGIPLNLYGDKGAMSSETIRRFASYFGIYADWHLPGNSRASGKVESRISSVKRLYETLWNSAIMQSRAYENTFDSFANFMHEWMIECNESRGLYSNYRLGLKSKDTVNENHIFESLLEPETKSVSNYGEILVDGTPYYINHPELNETMVTIERKYPNLIYATDYLGNTHECSTKLNIVSYGNFHAHKKSTHQRNREEVYAMAVDFKRNTSPDDLLPSKIIPLRREDKSIYSVKIAAQTLLEKTGILRHNVEDETYEMFLEYFRTAISEKGCVSEETMNKAIELLSNHNKEEEVN